MRRIVTYERVSSDDQRERDTIMTQYDELQRRLAAEPNVEIVERYLDNGVSGTKELRLRPDGARLLADAAARRFDEVWVYKLDRLGRDEIDPLVVRRDLGKLGISVVSIRENIETPLMYGLQVLMAAEERRAFLMRSRDGMARAAREGRYCGGIVPLGYVVEGKKQSARLAADEEPFWNDLSPAGLIRMMYHLSGDEGWSCYRLADHLNALKIPPAYVKDGRMVGNMNKGKRKEATAGIWRPSRVRDILTRTVYRGLAQHGKHPPKKDGVRPIPQIIEGSCVALVSEELWFATQQTLADHRLFNPKSKHRVYLLKARIKCGVCGLNYGGTPWGGNGMYRCNGRTAYRGPFQGHCTGRGLRGELIEPVVKADITDWLRDPGEVLAELAEELDGPQLDEAVAEAERQTLESSLAGLVARRKTAIGLATSGVIEPADLRVQLDDLDHDQAALQKRLDELTLPEPVVITQPVLPFELLAQLRARLDEGLSDEQWLQLVGLLVKQITVYSDEVPGVPSLRVVVEYNFGETPPDCGDSTDTGRGSRR